MRHCREYGIDPRIILGEDVLSHTPARIVMMPVFAMDVVHPRTGRWGLREIERIALLSRLLGPTRFLTRMEGRALEPRIRHGAYLMVDTAQDLPPAKSPDDASADEAGVPFALDIPGEGLVVRLTRYIDGRDSFELAALDRAVPTFVVPRGEDGCRIVGRVVWVAQEL
ncbi:S24 family peptidase [Solidesulfovibrio sp.]|uniref:S24 family peptidase n=1 Tax=Solidesulfovibrio sp. TaxID=2910990 RepID=UPI0026244FF8|nr:S24 family peptidase [Solidesulfovibrio sp.]